MLIIVLLTALLIGFGIYEFAAHRQRAAAIPIRVHVNGTRGKSSVTRLIAAGLREGGIKTLAKVTGTLPRIIDENGLEIPIVRLHPVNILEQIKVFKYFAKYKPKAVVMECMAVQPEYQWICEHQLVRSTLSVITNARVDHVREMGPSLENIANSLSNTVPTKGIMITAEDKPKLLSIMKSRCDENDSKMVVSDQEDVPSDDLRKFGHIEHRSNVSLALKVCEELGVDRETALAGMIKGHPDPGALKVYSVVNEGGRRVLFLNALAANDPESTLLAWERAWELYPDQGRSIVILNTRADRFDRSVILVEMMAKYMKFDYLVSMGESTEMLDTHLRRVGIPESKVKRIGFVDAEKAWNSIWNIVEDEALVFAMGNAGHGGLAMAELFRARRETDK